MSKMKSGAKTKGYIMNITKGTKQSFIYNPTTFSDSSEIKFGNIDSPGSSYPGTQYLGGAEKTITFELFLHDYNSTKVNNYIKFLNDFKPTRGTRFTPPSKLRFCFGKYIEDCVLTNIDFDYQVFDKKLKPVQVVAKLTLRVV